jgi:ribonuclease P protein component
VVCVQFAPPGAVIHEENVSAEQSASEANARISGADGHSRRSKRPQAAAGKGPQASRGRDPAEAAGVSERRPASFPKRARLRRRSDYLRVQREGRRQHTEHFVVLIAPNPRGVSRIGITVSTRVGSAVVRNRVKRIMREVLRPAWRAIDPPGDVVVIAKPGAAHSTHANAASQLQRALGLLSP